MKILVRSKRDADAVNAVLKRFAEVSHWRVESLGGLRGERLVQEIQSRIEPFTIILLGREEAGIYPLAKPLEDKIPFTAVIQARTRKVRNSTVEMIHSLLTRGRAVIRLKTKWNKSYILSGAPKGKTLDLPVEPYYDTFFLYSKGAKRILEILGLAGDPGLLLVLKGPRGLHYVFSGGTLVGKVDFATPSYKLEPQGEKYSDTIAKTSIEELIEENTSILELLEDNAIELIREAYNSVQPKRVVVPVSGGKDSSAALLLASKALDPDIITAIYVDTGIDFPENREAAERIASRAGIDLLKVTGGVDRGLMEGLPLPSPENRWCTGRKLEALRKGIEKVEPSGRVLLVVGDRDSESEKRSRRPLVRIDNALPYPAVSPLRLWSGAHVMGYLWMRGGLVNKLYSLGFYRTGCYLCFSLRAWELHIMVEEGLVSRIITSRPLHKRLFDRFLSLKSGAPIGER